MQTKMVHAFDGITRAWTVSYEVQEDPFEAGKFVEPIYFLETDPRPFDAGTWPVAGTGDSADKWLYVEDHRGATIFNQASADTSVVAAIGLLPDGWALTPPPKTPDQIAAEAAAQRTIDIANASLDRNARVQAASTQVSILTDATDPEVVATVDPAKQALLLLWKKYRQDLVAVDVTAVPVVWPVAPAAAGSTGA